MAIGIASGVPFSKGSVFPDDMSDPGYAHPPGRLQPDLSYFWNHSRSRPMNVVDGELSNELSLLLNESDKVDIIIQYIPFKLLFHQI
jgi:hypothetical protein